jgi:hypothetical protein
VKLKYPYKSNDYIELPAESGLMRELEEMGEEARCPPGDVRTGGELKLLPPKPRLVPPLSHFIKALWEMVKKGW